jgi:LuxR family maltose regulon positive regulatory protein
MASSAAVDWPRLERWLLEALDDEPGVLAQLEGEWIARRELSDPLPALLVASLAAQIVVTSFGNLTPLRKWVDRLAPAITLVPEEPLARLQLASGLLCRMDFGDVKGESEVHGARVARMGREAMAEMRLAGVWPHPNLVIAAGEQLPGHYAQTGENAHGSMCVDEQEKLAAHPGVDPRLAARAVYWGAAALRMLDDLPRSQAVYARLKETTAGLDWRWLKFQQTTMEGRPAFDGRDAPAAAVVLESLKALLDPARPMDAREYHHLAGWLAAIEGDYRRSEQHHRLALEAAEAASGSGQLHFLCRSNIAAALVGQGKFDDALATLPEPPDATPRIVSAFEATQLLIRALRARAANREDEFARHLTDGMARMREYELFRVFLNLPRELAILSAEALARDVEPVFVKKLIAWRHLVPPPRTGDSWPWPLRVKALGTFTVEVNGVALEGTRKGSDHRMDLLKVLAANDGKPLGVARVIELLWPDASPENGRKSFDMALSRLRKLLEQEESVVINDGKLAFSPLAAWCDTADLALLCDRPVGALGQEALERHAADVLARYRGGFLAGEQLDAPWAIEARERNTQRLVRQAQAVADALAERDSASAAVRLIEQAIEAAPLAEGLYISLMGIHAEAGNHAEGLRVFRRLREMLSIMLSVKPSAEALALARRLSEAAPG